MTYPKITIKIGVLHTWVDWIQIKLNRQLKQLDNFEITAIVSNAKQEIRGAVDRYK